VGKRGEGWWGRGNNQSSIEKGGMGIIRDHLAFRSSPQAPYAWRRNGEGFGFPGGEVIALLHCGVFVGVKWFGNLRWWGCSWVPGNSGWE